VLDLRSCRNISGFELLTEFKKGRGETAGERFFLVPGDFYPPPGGRNRGSFFKKKETPGGAPRETQPQERKPELRKKAKSIL